MDSLIVLPINVCEWLVIKKARHLPGFNCDSPEVKINSLVDKLHFVHALKL